MQHRLIIIVLVIGPLCAYADEQIFRTEGVVVSYDGISEAYAEAIATTVATAKTVAAETWGFDMPKTISVTVQTERRGRVRLFNDGQDRFSLTVTSEEDLHKPTASGIFHIYGLCHEVAHLGMYRVIRDHSWMTTAAAEGWAHYLGSHIVDAVHARVGGSLWPDQYDYLADGSRRLEAGLSAENPRPIDFGAALWKELMAIVGDKGVAPVFAAWGKAKVDPIDPGAVLRTALLATNADPRLPDWWNKAEPLLVIKRDPSEFAARTAKPTELTRQPIKHEHDDGRVAGKKSIAGGGHAVRFNVLGDGWYLTTVRIHGSRYGHNRAPDEDFHVWLCDKDFKVIADFPFPYAKFTKGRAKWINLKIPPTNVPQEFIICVGFNPTGTKGVFVSRDKEASGASLSGLPDRDARPFNEGDWLIRVSVDQLKIANPLEKNKVQG